MDHFIGLDGHKTSCTFVVLDPQAKVKRKAVIATEGQALAGFVKQVPGRRLLCTEEGSLSQWLFEILHRHVHDMAIVHGRKQKGNKDDFRDALDLANRMRTGDLGQRILKVPESLMCLKNLVQAYETLNKDVTRVKNRIKHRFRSRGIAMNSPAAKLLNQIAVQSVFAKNPGFKQSLLLLMEQQKKLEPLKEEAQQGMIAEAARHPITRILKTAPGIGPIRSAELLAIVITPFRFRTVRQFWAYCGLGIVQRSSSDWVQQPGGGWVRAPVYQTRGLNRNFNHTAKAIFKGAAMTVICSRGEQPLRADYDRLLANGTKPNLARLTLARKIAAIVLAMWKTQEGYDPEKHRMKQE